MGHLEFQEAHDELEGVIDLQDHDMLAVVSDFNVDFSHTDRCHTNDQLQFVHSTKACVYIRWNGYLSKSFKVSCSVRQGGILLPSCLLSI